jgi:transcriptional regulator with XRE-family HTH domain
MSNFGEELSKQLAARNMTAADLAARIEMSSSQLYNWTRGVQTTVSSEQFNVIAAALTDDEFDHARLLHAHLLDEKAENLGNHLIEVRLLASGEMKDRPRARSRRERALEILAGESVRDPDLSDLLVSLAGYVNSDLNEAETKIVAAVKKGAKEDSSAPNKPAK